MRDPDCKRVAGLGDVSKVLSFAEGFQWNAATRRIYKEDSESNWQGVSRTSLVGGGDGIAVPFHLRYFEEAARGISSREKHSHQHVVVIGRGSGTVLLGNQERPIGLGDVVDVAPWEVHQFRNADGS